MSIYWLGMAANDVFDRRKDALSAPRKPIPSGRVSVRAAVALCVALGATALGLGLLAGAPLFAAAILGAALVYDAGGKNTPVAGDLLMGACRSGNFLLGAVAAVGTTEALGEPRLILGAIILGLFIAGVTAVSRLEDSPFDAAKLRRRAGIIFLAPIALALVRPTEIGVWINAALLVWLLGNALRAASGAAVDPSARGVHGAAVFVRKALAGIFVVDAGLVLGVAPSSRRVWVPVLVLYGLFALAWLWKRRWIRAGSAGS